MATVRSEGKTALLVVDVQVGVMAGAWDASRVIANVETVVSRARDAAVPIVWVQHQGEELPHGSDPWQLVPELAPAPGEARIDKRFECSFEDTALEAELARLGVNRIVLAGAATNWCIRATAYGALDRGYDLVLVKDAHTTETMEFEDGRRIEARDIVDDLNVVMRWISYPGRSSGTATAAEVTFTTAGDRA